MVREKDGSSYRLFLNYAVFKYLWESHVYLNFFSYNELQHQKSDVAFSKVTLYAFFYLTLLIASQISGLVGDCYDFAALHHF